MKGRRACLFTKPTLEKLGQAAGNAAHQAIKSGATTRQAFTVGTVAGITEYLTEKLPLERMFKLLAGGGSPMSVTQAILNTVKQLGIQAGIEGFGENVSEYVGTVAQNIILGEKSEFNRYVKQLQAQGMSREAARNEALKQYFVINPALALLGGIISGGIFGGSAALLGSSIGGYDATRALKDAGLTDAEIGKAIADGMLPGLQKGAEVTQEMVIAAYDNYVMEQLEQAVADGDKLGYNGRGAGETATEGAEDKVYSPINPGPLSIEDANSFNGATYTRRILTEDTTFYRVYGGKAEKVGRYMSRTPQYGGMQSQLDLALNPKWGNEATYITKVTVPKGTVIYEGTAAPQVINGGAGMLYGGGNQVFIPEVNPSWFGS